MVVPKPKAQQPTAPPPHRAGARLPPLQWGWVGGGAVYLDAGGWGTEATILLRLALQTIVGRWSPCPVLQHPAVY